MDENETYWPHAPLHRLSAAGTYFVTASTYHRHPFFRGRDRLSVLHQELLLAAKVTGWQFEAWVVLANHYHFVAHSPAKEQSATSLRTMLTGLHRRMAILVNELDATPGRKVWHDYRETHLTYPRSYFTRLNYVHQNPVKHGLTSAANLYPWCSAAWFERTATPAQVKVIYSFKTDRVTLDDDFEPIPDW